MLVKQGKDKQTQKHKKDNIFIHWMTETCLSQENPHILFLGNNTLNAHFPLQLWITTWTDFLFLQCFSQLPLQLCHNTAKVEQRPLWHVPRLPETWLWIYSCLSYQAKNTWSPLLSCVPVSLPGKFHTPHWGQHFLINVRQLFAFPDPHSLSRTRPGRLVQWNWSRVSGCHVSV